MTRGYTKVKALEQEVLRMRTEGKSNREIGEYYGLTKEQIKNLIKRHNRRQKSIKQGHTPRPKGRPRKYPITTQKELELENKQLKMENELLRDFLCEVERG